MDDALRAELLRRIEPDQAARRERDLEAVQRADAENLPWLKQVIATHGWPGKSLVGPDGASAAWLLVQHADADPAFQRQCLGLLIAAAAAGEATGQELAYLTDRVLLAEGRPQVYGSQVQHQDGAWRPCDLGDPDHVDERRATVGLSPLAEYLRGFADFPLPQPRLQCPGCGAWVPFERPGDAEPVTVTCDACGQVTRLPGSGGRE